MENSNLPRFPMSRLSQLLQQAGGFLWQSMPTLRNTGDGRIIPIFDLPAEIRLQIYEAYFRVERVWISASGDPSGKVELSPLLQAHPQIRHEAEELYLPNTRFFAIIDADARGLFTWLRSIGPEKAAEITYLALACDLTKDGKMSFAVYQRPHMAGRRPTIDALGIREDWVSFFENLLARGVRAEAITTFRLDIERMSNDRLDQFRLLQHRIFEEKLERSLTLAVARIRERMAD